MCGGGRLVARRKDVPKKLPFDGRPSDLERYDPERYQLGYREGREAFFAQFPDRSWFPPQWTLEGFAEWLADRSEYRRAGGDLHNVWSRDRYFMHLQEKNLPEQLVRGERARYSPVSINEGHAHDV